ncbi:alpha/beta fold hydrolase [Colwellia piezophila]|uniref:alpha/beta fold hydrolase n=1 Tax=Colwellia piezophila TaxID=211668 RepID=UPI0003646506|nr:alpha/beta hydrolase [Colwellia piezophila]
MVDTHIIDEYLADDSEITEINYQLDDLTLAAVTCGDKNDPPILCLHGYLDNAASFLPLMNEHDLLQDKYIIAVEWPGHGHSDHRCKGAHYHFFDYVSDLVALFSLNNWPAIDIVAHSMGAMVASAFAAAFPEKVKSLTLIDSIGFISQPAEHATKQLRQGLLSRKKSVKPSRTFSEVTAIKARLHVSDLKDDHAKLIVKRSLLAVTDPLAGSQNASEMARLYRWRSDSRLRTISPYRLTLAQAQQLFSDIQCPVLLVYGDKGMQRLTQNLSLFSSSLTIFRAVKLVGGHHVHMEQAKELTKLLNSFYQEN